MFAPVPRAKPRALATTKQTNPMADAVNALAQTFHVGSGQFQEMALQTRVIKRGTQISSQPGRFNGRTMQEIVFAKGNATGGVTETDLGTVQTVDDCILWEISAATDLTLCRYIGHDTAADKPIYAIFNSGLFPVKVVKDGGTQGNATTAASWTYTVKTVSGNTIKTAVTLGRNRPKGTATAPADNSYGTAFYDASVLVLWDANEVYGAAACP